MEKQMNWAVLGTGVIANEMAQALQKMGKRLYGVGNRTHWKAVDFAAKYGVEKVYDRMEDLFADPKVDIVYLTTPHNTHIRFLREALKNGKHVLCEKSITLNSGELEEAIGLARERGVILAEAMTIWHMPLYRKLRALLREGAFGRVQMLQINFGSFKEYDMENRFFNRNLAGGALLDIGVYALSLARSFLDSCPDQVKSLMKQAPTGVDEQAGILLMNPEGQMAGITLSLHSRQPKRAVISCEKGYLEISDYPRADSAVFVDAVSGRRTQIEAGRTEDALLYEMQDMEAAVISGDDSAMNLSLTAEVMRLMTGLREEWGLRYPEEEREN
ncbi:MAG TPA: Gfo/Idh/MocA family oxidoreductase [Candidatus Eisenbergiella pullicola]|nr:Gfo/Idh/MocA family oxidoreductase [Candidatus Eisenbergiella pullicola]